MKQLRILNSLLTFSLIAGSLSGQDATIVPFKLVSTLVFIELTINESEPLHFMFDTGAGVTVIDPTTAEKLSLLVSDSARIGTSGGSIQSATSTNNQLKIGDLEVPGIDLEIIPLEHLATYLKHPLDGIIGYDLLSQFLIEVNVDEGLFKLFPPTAKTPHLTQAKVVEMLLLPYGHFGIKTTLQADKKGKKIPMVLKIDSGFEDYLSLNGQTVDRHQLLDGRRTKKAEGMSADPTITRNFSTRMYQFSFAEHSWKKVQTVLTIDSINVQSTRKDVSEGIIGQELLLDFNVLYDMKNKKIHFQKRVHHKIDS